MPAFDALLQRLRSTTSLDPVAPNVAQPQLLSPLATSPKGALQHIAFHDVFEHAPEIATRADAMAVPAVAKARNLLVSLIAGKPLVALDDAGQLDEQPAWLQDAGAGVSPQHRMAWTLDDLVFAGTSLWVLDRTEAGAPIQQAVRWPIDQWELDKDARVLVSGQPVASHQIILFTSFGESLLTNAARTMKGATLLETAWVRRANDPIPVVDLHMTHEDAISDEDAKELAEAWDTARRTGATAVTPAGIDARVLGQVSPDLFVQGRNATRLDIAGFFNLPAQLLDASLSTASLTYSTQEGRSNELATMGLPYWTDPITSRLSLDDITPAGTRIRFDLSELHALPVNPTGTPAED